MAGKNEPSLPDVLIYLDAMGLSSQDFENMSEEDRAELVTATMMHFSPEEISDMRDKTALEQVELMRAFSLLKQESNEISVSTDAHLAKTLRDTDPRKDILAMASMERIFADEITRSDAALCAETRHNFDFTCDIQPSETDFETSKVYEIQATRGVADHIRIILPELASVDFGQGSNGELIVYVTNSFKVITIRIHGWEVPSESFSNLSHVDKITIQGGIIDERDILELAAIGIGSPPSPEMSAANIVFQGDNPESLYFKGLDLGLFSK